MSAAQPINANEPIEPVQRRPTDALWFTVLFASIVVGIGMTILAPVGDEPKPVQAIGAPSPSTEPSTAPAVEPTSSPATAPAP